MPETGIATSAARPEKGAITAKVVNGERCRAAGDGPCPSATAPRNSTGAKPKLKKTIPPKSVAVARRAIRLMSGDLSRPAAPVQRVRARWACRGGARTCAGLGRSTLGSRRAIP